MIEQWVIGDLMNLALEGPRRLAIDVGANIGEWSRWLSGHFGCVVAVEPDPRATALFQHIGVPQKCFILPVACGDSCRIAQYQIRSTHEQSSLLPEHPIGGGDQAEVKTVAEVPVRVVTLDWIAETFPRDSIDLVKIDVEGSEADVLAGIAARMDRFAETRFLIELHDRDVEVGRELERLGRKQVVVKPHCAAGAHPKHKWLFVPPA